MASRYIGWAVAVCITASCRQSPLMPRSGGRPYEVVLTGDMDSIVCRELRIDAEGLPQPEPCFDVIAERELPLARNIVRVDADSLRYSRTHIRYDRDVSASPQLVVYIHTPGREALRRDMPSLGKALRRLITLAEMERAASNLQQRHNSTAERAIAEMFGISISVPADLTATKRAHDFIWLSSTGSGPQRCLCIYAVHHPYPAADTSVRDSVMGLHIKGETDAMQMRTAGGTSTVYSHTTKDGRTEYIVHGLWEMEGDAMGGPFTQRILPRDSTLTIVAEAFVFAPGMKKRNLMRELEAGILEH